MTMTAYLESFKLHDGLIMYGHPCAIDPSLSLEVPSDAVTIIPREKEVSYRESHRCLVVPCTIRCKSGDEVSVLATQRIIAVNGSYHSGRKVWMLTPVRTGPFSDCIQYTFPGIDGWFM